MTYKEHGMWEVLEVLKRVHRGEGRRKVARSTNHSRSTVGRYIAVAQDMGWVPGLHEPDEALAADVFAKLKPGPRDKEPGKAARLLGPQEEQLKRWLAADEFCKQGMPLTKVHGLLERRGVAVSYSELYRYAVKHLGFGRKRATVRVAESAPGEEAEVDFGRLGFLIDPETNRKRVLHALVVTLTASRHQYVHLTHGQKVENLILGLEEAWESFGGVPARVVIDNMKAAVLKACRYDPVFERTFNEYADYRGFIIDAAAEGEPTHKPHVERGVPYVRRNFFAGERFLSLVHAQLEAVRWCTHTAGMRVHGTTRKQPLAEFEAHEKAALTPLSKERFDVPRWGKPTVHPDCHVRFNYALYSVPYQYRGKETDVRGDTKLVRIYVDGVLVKTHPAYPKGGRSTDYSDYPEEKSPYAMRDANYIVARAQKQGQNTGEFAEKLLSGKFPWAKLRQAQKLLRLSDKYGAKNVDSACQRALRFDLINVKRVEGILKHALDCRPGAQDPQEHEPQVIQLPLRFLRDAQSFSHKQQTKETT